MPTPGSKIWYTDKNGVLTNFGTAVAAGVATTDIYRVTQPSATQTPDRRLKYGLGRPVSAGDVTAAQAEQDTAAAPSVSPNQGQPSSQVADAGALTAAAAAAAPTKVEFDKVVVDLAMLRTKVNELAARSRQS